MAEVTVTHMKKIGKVFSRVYDESVEVSDRGVLHVDANRLLNKESVKRQLQAVRRLERASTPARQRKTG